MGGPEVERERVKSKKSPPQNLETFFNACPGRGEEKCITGMVKRACARTRNPPSGAAPEFKRLRYLLYIEYLFIVLDFIGRSADRNVTGK